MPEQLTQKFEIDRSRTSAMRFTSVSLLESITYRTFVGDLTKNLSSQNIDGFDRAEIQHKLSAYKPRRSGAVGAYAVLSGRSFEDTRHDGLNMYRLFFYFGDVLDENLDAIDKSSFTGDKAELRRITFEQDQLLGSVLNTLTKEINKIYDYDTRDYLTNLVNEYIDFVIDQEWKIIQTDTSEYGIDFSVNFRETQNKIAGRVCTALLNGSRALDVKYKKIEDYLYSYSYLTQFTDDMGDMNVDIMTAGGRPSFMVGALIETGEFENVRALYETGVLDGKPLPKEIQKYAPKSYQLIVQKFEEYASRISETIPQAKFLVDLARFSFYHFPYIRNAIYPIPILKKYAYF